MLNYAEWTEKLQDFIARIRSFPGEVDAKCTVDRPVDASALAKLNRALRIKIPREIQQFLLTASGGCTYRLSLVARCKQDAADVCVISVKEVYLRSS